jgi:hypothetical protein
MGKAERPNGAFGKSDIEGKAAMRSGERAAKRTSFKWTGAHESKLGDERVSIGTGVSMLSHDFLIRPS